MRTSQRMLELRYACWRRSSADVESNARPMIKLPQARGPKRSKGRRAPTTSSTRPSSWRTGPRPRTALPTLSLWDAPLRGEHESTVGELPDSVYARAVVSAQWIVPVPDAVGSIQSTLVDNQSLCGFETLADWSAPSDKLALRTQHSRETHSLAPSGA